MTKYTESRTLSAYTLRSLCIAKNWYTCGDNDEYSALFARLHHDFLPVQMTAEKLAEIATDIYEHSDADDCTDGYLDIPSIMYDLAKACDTTFGVA